MFAVFSAIYVNEFCSLTLRQPSSPYRPHHVMDTASNQRTKSTMLISLRAKDSAFMSIKL